MPHRNGNIIRGKDSIRAFFVAQKLTEYKLNWSPDFIEVSDSGDLAYTYGKYQMDATAPDGTPSSL